MEKIKGINTNEKSLYIITPEMEENFNEAVDKILNKIH